MTTTYWRDTDGRRCRIDNQGSTSISWKEIPKETYEYYKSIPREQVEEEYGIPSYCAGYGYYGMYLSYDNENDVYLIGIRSGNSCD